VQVSFISVSFSRRNGRVNLVVFGFLFVAVSLDAVDMHGDQQNDVDHHIVKTRLDARGNPIVAGKQKGPSFNQQFSSCDVHTRFRSWYQNCRAFCSRGLLWTLLRSR